MHVYLEGRVTVLTGDITREHTDAVVNAANSSLLGGGGVDGAIHAGGGPEILSACREIRKKRFPEGLPTGEAVITTAGSLPARFVIHTAGPVWHGGSSGEDALLASAYRNSLLLADGEGVDSIAFPAISTGIYGFPSDRAARIVSNVLKEFTASHGSPRTIRLVFFNAEDMDVFVRNCGLS